MINSKILLLFVTFVLIPLMTSISFAEIQTGGFGNSPFERTFGDVKFLNAYFGTSTEKIEVGLGDNNVPFTVEFANVGSQDITGIRGQLLLPYGFSSIDGSSSLIFADSNSNSLAGENFSLTFYVNIDKNAEIQQYPATVKVDYSRLRESGIRTSFSDFNFKVTGNSLINAKAVEPFLTSLTSNNVPIEISNAGSAPLSSLDIVIDNAQTTTASTTASTTNVENVIIFETNWNLGNIESHSSRIFTATIYVPESLKGDTLRIPLTITYYDSHGEQKVISKIVDFYVKGLIDLIIYDVNVIELSGQQMVVGQIINEGNEDGLFGFVTLKSLNGSNIKTNTQFIDEIEIDAPVPFNVPIEFDGEPKYGEHEISITVRYKDSVRDEIFLNHDATIIVKEPSNVSENNSDPTIIIISILIVISAGIYIIRRRKNVGIMTINYFKSKTKK